MEKELVRVKVRPNGPLAIVGTVEIEATDGIVEVKENPYLCRCGQSKNKPYCDGAHVKAGFKD